MSKIRINSSLCQKCGLCVRICPENVFLQIREASVPKIVHAKACISCGHCVDTCPAGAVTHSEFPDNVENR